MGLTEIKMWYVSKLCLDDGENLMKIRTVRNSFLYMHDPKREAIFTVLSSFFHFCFYSKHLNICSSRLSTFSNKLILLRSEFSSGIQEKNKEFWAQLLITVCHWGTGTILDFQHISRSLNVFSLMLYSFCPIDSKRKWPTTRFFLESSERMTTTTGEKSGHAHESRARKT